MKTSPVVQRSYRGLMEYVKRLSNKEAGEAGALGDGEKPRSNCVAISQTNAGIVGATHPPACEVGQDNW
jgi:hypothetical protein